MIEKRYRKNINVANPKNYFEKWYADVWNRLIGSQRVSSSSFFKVFTSELSKIGAEICATDDAYYSIYFKDERDYIMFVLRWG